VLIAVQILPLRALGSSPTVRNAAGRHPGNAASRRSARQAVEWWTVPSYEFRCRECSTTFEVSRPMSASSDPAICPDGHDDTVRLLSIAGLARGGDGAAASAGGSGACCGGGCCG
jgi:putative FmdB family regulatory protein